eukprot:6992760-Prymnesium_polylepis.1
MPKALSKAPLTLGGGKRSFNLSGKARAQKVQMIDKDEAERVMKASLPQPAKKRAPAAKAAGAPDPFAGAL